MPPPPPPPHYATMAQVDVAAAGVHYEKTWCVANPSSNWRELQANKEYAFNHVDCSLINSACFNPDIPISLLSVVMDLYYQSVTRNSWTCNFSSSALVAVTDSVKH